MSLAVVASCIRRFWKPWLGLMWLAVLAVFFVLMGGGVFGLEPVRTDLWGGLPLTVMLATLSIFLAFPARRAGGARAAQPAAGDPHRLHVYIELIRGVPLISVLFMASFMFPLFMPQGMTIDVLVRVLVGHHAVRCRLHGRDRARRPAGGPARARSRRPPRSACATGRRSARSCCRRRWRWWCRAS